MSNKAVSVLTPIIGVLSMVAISMTALNYQGLAYSEPSGTSGQIVSLASAVEIQTVEKEVGQFIHIKAKVKNTGDLETTYIILAKWRQDGTEEWETAGLADLRLSSGQESDILIIGAVECTETMMDKYFDVKIILYEYDTETALDEKQIDKAWYVKETLVSGTVTGYWVV